ncbi:MAG TPA: Crp/Fnr family transcriptional regulator [Qipengyuania sp.]|nr:Crp/Fnr family transcriptional regulator [Qipengyuania sp.]
MHGLPQTTEYPITGDFLAGRRQMLDADDRQHLEWQFGEPQMIADGQTLFACGAPVQRATMLVEGFVFRVIRRQEKRFIVGVHVPGDFVDLHGFVLGALDHDVVAVGPARIAQIEHDRLTEVTGERPAIASALWFATLLDASIHRQWIHNLQALDAPQRIAHLFAELHHRFTLIGRNVNRALRTPFTQTDLADMCGVSAIHANRAVARLRDLGLAEIRRGDVYTVEWKAFEAYAGFDPAYLYGEPMSR